MTVDVTVFTGAGVNIAPEIIDPLSSTNSVARERGKAFLAEYSGVVETSLVTRSSITFYPGDIVEVFDSKQGMVYYGRITHGSHRVSLTNSTVTMETTLEIAKFPA